MKKTSKVFAALAVVAVALSLGACSNDSNSTGETTSPASQGESAKANNEPTKAAAEDEPAQKNADSYCAALDDFYDASINGLKDLDVTNVNAAMEYVEKVKAAADKAADAAPDQVLADAWRSYADGLSMENASSQDGEFSTALGEGMQKYCLTYDFKHLGS